MALVITAMIHSRQREVSRGLGLIIFCPAVDEEAPREEHMFYVNARDSPMHKVPGRVEGRRKMAPTEFRGHQRHPQRRKAYLRDMTSVIWEEKLSWETRICPVEVLLLK